MSNKHGPLPWATHCIAVPQGTHGLLGTAAGGRTKLNGKQVDFVVFAETPADAELLLRHIVYELNEDSVVDRTLFKQTFLVSSKDAEFDDEEL